MERIAFIGSALGLILLAACTPASQRGLLCSTSANCDPGEVCTNGECTLPSTGGGAGGSSAGGSGNGGGSAGGSAGGSGANTCSHSECTSGSSLVASCSACASTVCAADAYCCSTSWNARCVTEAESECGGALSCSGGGSGGGTAGGAGGGTGGGSGGGTGGSSGGSGGGSAGGSAGGSGGGTAGGSGGGSGTSGSIGPTGGTVDHLYFAVIGDTRPYDIDSTSTYPTAIVDKIYQEIQGLSPQPQFVVATGDYMYANISAGTAQPQVDLYMAARAAYTGMFFPAMGNHECDGYTADNCTSFTQSDNIKAFMGSMITPLGLSVPYYEVDINGTKNDFTSKMLVVGCNYWNTTQQSWLTSAIAKPTTYTILVRHEDSGATTGPCVNTVESLMSQSTYNLSIVGHSHTFSVNASTKEIVVGNGGVQQSAVPYGFATFEVVNGAFQIKQYDYSTGLPINSYTVQ